MTFDQLRKIEKEYADYLKRQPFFDSTKVQTYEDKKWALWICYKKGMTPSIKKAIATELGGIPLHWHQID